MNVFNGLRKLFLRKFINVFDAKLLMNQLINFRIDEPFLFTKKLTALRKPVRSSTVVFVAVGCGALLRTHVIRSSGISGKSTLRRRLQVLRRRKCRDLHRYGMIAGYFLCRFLLNFRNQFLSGIKANK